MRVEGRHSVDLQVSSGRRYRLVLADDHPGLLEEIRRLLDPEFDVLGAVGDGAALVEAVADLRPDAVVSDIQMPRMDGIAAGSEILGRGLCEAVVVLSMYPDPQLVEKAFAAGIRGYVLKLDACEELIPAVYALLRGERYSSRGIRSANSDFLQ
jgi:DNA-binding NarL/FixJ family response regulator